MSGSRRLILSAVEHWGVHDHLSFMQQIGALPTPPPEVSANADRWAEGS
jgi:hypothetical protein